ncbi:winged helix-turn-helix domain-containing protein [Haloferax volcanii]|uniref:winged helix-turn-helix domain-containing protein n=1 Tax=Haloferax volcanii TaxID=2246 RepID=UPI00385392F4
MSGRKRTVSDEEILEILLDSEDPFLTTTEVAEVLDFSQPGALKRLRQLEEEEYVETKKAGNSNTWWITEEGREMVSSKS